MKRDPELIRQLLLDLERSEDKNVYTLEGIIALSSNKSDLIPAHVRLLVEEELLVPFTDHYQQMHRGKFCVSSAGYDFLDTVRDDEVWRKTKAVAEDVKSFTIETIKDIGKGFISTQIKKLTGVDIQ